MNIAQIFGTVVVAALIDQEKRGDIIQWTNRLCSKIWLLDEKILEPSFKKFKLNMNKKYDLTKLFDTPQL